MNSDNPEALMFKVMLLCSSINNVSRDLYVHIGEIFNGLPMSPIVLLPAELGVIRFTSRLYVIYYEIGGPSIIFLIERFTAYEIDVSGESRGHFAAVQKLHAFLSNNINPDTSQERSVSEPSRRWLHAQCGSHAPEKDEQWEQCLVSLLTESITFLTCLKMCIHKIEQDESREQILRDWEFSLKRYHLPREFDVLIAEVAADMGRDMLDAISLRRRYYDIWVKELAILQGNYDFKVEIRKRIEHVLMFESIPILPVTGEDMIQELKIRPGPEVETLLRRARILYDASPCSRDELIEKLKPGRQHLTTRLTRREHEILRLAAQGKTDEQVAQDLVVSSATVKFHVKNILAKFEAKNKTAAVNTAKDLGII